MSPQLILVVAQLLLKYGVDAARSFVLLFQKGDPTIEDWNALFDKVKTYEDYAPPVPKP
jgi:hypothetical protein